MKGVHQPLAVCLVLPFGFPTLGLPDSSYRVHCDFLPIKIESRKKQLRWKERGKQIVAWKIFTMPNAYE